MCFFPFCVIWSMQRTSGTTDSFLTPAKKHRTGKRDCLYPSCNSNTRRLNTCGQPIGCIEGGTFRTPLSTGLHHSAGHALPNSYMHLLMANCRKLYVFTAKTTATYSLWHQLHTLTAISAMPRSTQLSTLFWT